MKAIITALTIALAACSVSAKDYYVSKTGIDGNPGTKAKPLKTISAAADVAKAGDTIRHGQIMLGTSATDLETYASRELQRCLYQLSGELMPIVADDARLDKATFIVGRIENNNRLKELSKEGLLTVSATDPGEQGYVLKKLVYKGQKIVVIAGSDKEGVLYGTYGLLDDYLGVGFYFSGDVFPDKKEPIKLGVIDERKTPRQYIRGVLPWSNFPTSSTSYSFEDYKYFFDQMAKMRFNLLHLHNYWGYWDYNEMYHNITYNGITPRLKNATASTGHVWAGRPGWDVNKYQFGTKDLFLDYDFGTDASLHNEGLSNIEVSRKGANLFKRVIEYAHSRGIKVALGLEIDSVPAELGVPADDPGLVDARVDQLISDYPGLDYLLCYRNETFAGEEQKALWYKNLDQIYSRFKADAPETSIGVSGWGLDGDAVSDLPADIISAPIARYGPTMESGSIYGQREYWGCPWVENDGEIPYFNPSEKWGRLSATVNAYNNHAANMRGFTTLTWRLTDAMEPKLSYIAKAPWDQAGKYESSFDLYYEYAVKNYGLKAAELLADLLDKDDPGLTGFGECLPTPEFKGADMTEKVAMVDELLATVAKASSLTTAKGELARIRKLRSRLLRFKSYCQLEQSSGTDADAWRTFAREMAWSVDDISSLGNNVSLQNRFVQLRLPAEVSEGISPLDIPLVKVISPPVSAYADEPFELVARVLDNDSYEAVSATIHYRNLGEESFKSIGMTRRVKAIFAARIPGKDISAAGLEYYVSVTDGSNTGYWPDAAPELPMSCTILDQLEGVTFSPALSLTASEDSLSWQGSDGDVRYYRIYRSKSENEPVSRATYLTYVDKDTFSFLDLAGDFEGNKLEGKYWYRVTAVDSYGRESKAAKAVPLVYDSNKANTIHVSVSGSDLNNGIEARPFRTISAAANMAQPGDTITVHEGVYRERINPPRGGTSDEKRITYQAAKGEKVVVKGSEVVTDWKKVENDTWKAVIPNSFFGDFNPFDDLIRGDWFWRKDMDPHTAAVYLNGHWLIEAGKKDEVLAPFGSVLDQQGQALLNMNWLKVGDGSKRIAAGSFSAQSGIEIQECTDDESGKCIGKIKDGDWVQFDDVDFGKGTNEVFIRVESLSIGATIELRLNSPQGRLLGTASVSAPGGGQSWTTSIATIKPISGVRKFCLVFKYPKRVITDGLWFAEVDDKDTTIWAQFKGVDPNKELVEVNVRKSVFYPDQPGINYITVRGFELAHAATPWSPPTAEQIGLIGTHWSKGWIIENNVIRYSACVGVTLGKYGDEFDNKAESAFGYNQTIKRALKNGWTKENIGSHIVRNNHISHCEQAGIVGSMGAVFSTITGNEIHDIHVRRLFTGAEMGGIKIHAPIDMVISNNHIYHAFRGIWLDWMTQGARVTGNLLHDNGPENIKWGESFEAMAPGGQSDMFLEVNHGPLLIDNNIFLSPYSVNNRSQGVAFAHNIFAGAFRIVAHDKRLTPYHKAHSTQVVQLHDNPCGDNHYYNNVFVEHGDLSGYDTAALQVTMEGNVYLNGASPSKHETDPLVQPNVDPGLKLIEKSDGWYLEMEFDKKWSDRKRRMVASDMLGKAIIPDLPYEQPDGSPYRIDADYFGNKRNTKNPYPGPFKEPKEEKQLVKVWPKK